MTIPKLRGRKQISRIHLLILVSLAMLGLTAWRTSSSTKTDGPHVTNQTTAFEVVGVDVVDDTLTIALSNVSGKIINGYSVAVNGAIIRTDYTIGESAIAPGQTEKCAFPYSSNEGPEIEIQAVVFTDRTFNGSIAAANSILHRREGLKTQLAAIDALLNGALASSDRKLPAALSRLGSEVESLPEGPLESRALRTGLRDGKSDAKKILHGLLQETGAATSNLRQRLAEIRRQLKERASRL